MLFILTQDLPGGGQKLRGGSGIDGVGILLPLLQQYTVFCVQGPEPIQRFLRLSEELFVPVVLRQVIAKDGAAQRGCTDAEKENEQNCSDDFLSLHKHDELIDLLLRRQDPIE